MVLLHLQGFLANLLLHSGRTVVTYGTWDRLSEIHRIFVCIDMAGVALHKRIFKFVVQVRHFEVRFDFFLIGLRNGSLVPSVKTIS